MSSSNPPSHKIITLALSGPSSSGKTSMSHLLHKLLLLPNNTNTNINTNSSPNTSISSILIHQDDFYLPEPQLPQRNGVPDWDSALSLDTARLVGVLQHVKAHGELPVGFVSIQSPPPVASQSLPSVSPEIIADCRAVLVPCFATTNTTDTTGTSTTGSKEGRRITLIILDGFLLLGRSMDVLQEYLDMRILLRSSFQATKSRREARKGYAVDGEGGWWVDPVGYVEDVVWPAYVDEHSFLFVDGDVEGVVQWDVAWLRGIDVAPLRIAGGSGSGHGDGGGEEREVELGELLGWVVDVVARRVGEILGGSVDGEG